jgi:hypothetical protein
MAIGGNFVDVGKPVGSFALVETRWTVSVVSVRVIRYGDGSDVGSVATVNYFYIM